MTICLKSLLDLLSTPPMVSDERNSWINLPANEAGTFRQKVQGMISMDYGGPRSNPLVQLSIQSG